MDWYPKDYWLNEFPQQTVCIVPVGVSVGGALIKLIHVERASLLWVAPFPRQRVSGELR